MDVRRFDDNDNTGPNAEAACIELTVPEQSGGQYDPAARHIRAARPPVVLNTIDDGLRDDEQVSDQTWHLRDVDYLPELLRAAATASRPVILTSDHGHVLDRDTDMHPANGDSARHRTGEPGDGEVAISGQRVLTPGGQVVVPYDESIRYRPRRAGYHGGATLAEMVIPVLVFLPSPRLVPKGWSTYDNPSLHEPTWWEGSVLAMETATGTATGTAPVEARKAAAPRASTRTRRIYG